MTFLLLCSSKPTIGRKLYIQTMLAFCCAKTVSHTLARQSQIHTIPNCQRHNRRMARHGWMIQVPCKLQLTWQYSIFELLWAVSSVYFLSSQPKHHKFNYTLPKVLYVNRTNATPPKRPSNAHKSTPQMHCGIRITNSSRRWVNPFNLQRIRSRLSIERKWVLFVCCFWLYTIWWFEVMQFCAYLITKWKSHRSHRYKWVQHQIIQTTTDAHCVTALAIKSWSISSSSPHHSQRQQSFGLELCVVLRIHTCLLRLCRLGLFFLTIPLIVCATPQRELCESMFAICREARILCSEYCIYTSNSHTRALMACSLESLG